jgi:phosphoribosylanthranilate isomerase
VADAVANLRPAGVDVASGVESSPGRKDPVLLRDFITRARQAHDDTVARDAVGGDDGEEPYDWRDG